MKTKLLVLLVLASCASSLAFLAVREVERAQAEAHSQDALEAAIAERCLRLGPGWCSQ